MASILEAHSNYLRYPKRMRRGNDAQLRHDGEAGLSAMLRAIRNAKTSVLMEFYIFQDDATGQVFADALIERARSGVLVHVMVDAWGNMDVDATFYESLAAAGVILSEYRPIGIWNALRGPGRRNHRKVLVVDYRLGFVGGLNISDKYASVGQGGEGWRDTLIEVQGPVVNDLIRLMLNSYKQVNPTGPVLERPPSPPPVNGTMCAALLTNSERGQRHRIRKSYLKAIHAARETIIIANAYFLPGLKVRRALTRAVRRGVRVRILLPRDSDIPVVAWASRFLFAGMMRRGIELYEWSESMLHAKVAVVDSVWSTVGSYNLDQRSLRSNLEANVVLLDEQFGSQLHADLCADIDRSERILPTIWSRRSLAERLRAWFFYQFRSFM